MVECTGRPRAAPDDADPAVETRILLGGLEEAYPDLQEQVTDHLVLRNAIGTGDEAVAVRLTDEHMDDAVRRLPARRGQLLRASR